MPVEAILLQAQWIPFRECPKCGAAPFEPFLRGQIQRGLFGQLWAWMRGDPNWRGYCALICSACKETVGYER